ncbi:Mov34/MPN/PAD-1 family protein [Methanobacterium paludis]|uniref:Mov34/MPN/PAD-1 family protein n=1 Tax=Methanobacterium paludis (strain DSM 25820 / JCM 18151 / SWAN1) TaxID=868131 RepID=F6D6S7_METPW|nr:Mov34/MPN/PAD-1 family protein [Methanobacterium paludis]AEG18965.1 Mov34/MPN/PAD-1 family protein [Methanobacterium paludis]
MKKIDKFFGTILGNRKKEVSEVQIDREVVEEIIQIAEKSYPLEFSAILQGKIEDNILKIEGLIFLPGAASEDGAVMEIFMMPMLSDDMGSVHSHPGYSAMPSTADLQFFAKRGLFHIIIAQPYDLNSIRAYDSFGEPMDYTIV